MSVKNYRFVSPGVFVNEIDNSQLPASPAGEGPVIIGRAEKGPAMRPVTVNSFSEFVNIFGSPVPGGMGGDVWREGNQVSPMYGTYAAQALPAQQFSFNLYSTARRTNSCRHWSRTCWLGAIHEGYRECIWFVYF